ncbi:hypothetical protein ANTHELSMS3_03565 [Antarctobacter heliothermus]|uniref:Cytochrome c domain-containing protein n=2 Tax=Antarctobacter heliothermus TaxID=74033 RepID=A0A222E7W1_9RHOB|nr:hypothetical protein ANTHELSMS3_03565 [Antarctobacter heliothermus]
MSLGKETGMRYFGVKAGLLAFLPLAAGAQDFGVDMPAEPAPGIVFPTAEEEINSWIYAQPQNSAAIHGHAWGIWAGLTNPVDGEGAFARVTYQTWLTKANVIAVFTGKEPQSHFQLGESSQMFRHGLVDGFLADAASEKKDGTEPKANAAGIIVNADVLENVAYSPPSASYLLETGTGKPEVLDRLLADGDKVQFPDNAVNVKPVYKLITEERLTDWTDADGRTRKLYAFTAWPGVPDLTNWTPDMKEGGYPETLWQQCVYVDMDLKGPTTSTGVDVNCKSPGAGNIYSIDDFIAVDLKAQNAAFVNKTTGETEEIGGDGPAIALLVAMHVTSRETTQWTWQTFWWEADAAHPNTPSSAAIAAARPSPLTSQAAHYAMAPAYSMLVPAQPLVGGKNVGELVTAFNPYLEAGFGTPIISIMETVQTPDGKGAWTTTTTDMGIQTNCMTCHGLAAWGGRGSNYAANFYVPRDYWVFDTALDVDFAWSVEAIGNAIKAMGAKDD